MNVRLRYLIRVTITRNYNTCIKEAEFAVQNYMSVSSKFNILTCSAKYLFVQIANQAIAQDAPSQGIKMEVGIEDCLHIEFEFDKQKYHLQVTVFL